MADVVLFKNKQDNDDVWAEMEKDLRGQFTLSGIPQAIVSPILDRMRVMQANCLAVDLNSLMPSSLTVQLGVRLTEDEIDLVKKQIEAHLRDELYPLYVVKILCYGVAGEVGRMENELYQLRKQLGA